MFVQKRKNRLLLSFEGVTYEGEELFHLNATFHHLNATFYATKLSSSHSMICKTSPRPDPDLPRLEVEYDFTESKYIFYIKKDKDTEDKTILGQVRDERLVEMINAKDDFYCFLDPQGERIEEYEEKD